MVARVKSESGGNEFWCVLDTDDGSYGLFPTGTEEVASHVAGLHNIIDLYQRELTSMLLLMREAHDRIDMFRNGECGLVDADGLVGMQAEIFLHMSDFHERHGLPPLDVQVDGGAGTQKKYDA